MSHFAVADIKCNFLGTLFLEKYIRTNDIQDSSVISKHFSKEEPTIAFHSTDLKEFITFLFIFYHIYQWKKANFY